MSTTAAEKHAFQAEVNEVLSIVVHSLYSHREVFLRELISNASDALDQLNLRALTEPGLLEGDQELRIEIVADKKAGTLTIRDNGIGMTRADLIENLGTIARSGTKKLMESLTSEQKKDVALIGQFGVGFYSAFLVADTVSVLSRRAGSGESWVWESQAKDDFEVRPGEGDRRGTDVTLHLKEDALEYLDEWPIREIVRKYPGLRALADPPRGRARRRQGDEEGVADAQRRAGPLDAPEGRAHARAVRRVLQAHEPRLAGAASPDALQIEGTHELTGLLSPAGKAPVDLFDRRKGGVRLFVKRVFILDDAQEIRQWLRFVRGVVDSEDLPLNVSREILQRDATTKFIRKQVVTKTVALLEELAREGETTVGNAVERDGKKEKRERYLEFWREFGRVLKEGVYHEADLRPQLAGLLRYESSRAQGLTGLAAYKQRMPADQKAIYYVGAESLATAQASPHIEALKKKGYEVLFLIDPIDEWVIDALREFDGTPLVSAAKGALDLPESEDEKRAKEQSQKDLAPVLERMGKVLEARVQSVRVTDRLTDSPACLISEPSMKRAWAHAATPARRARAEAHPEVNPERGDQKAARWPSDDAKFSWTGLLRPGPARRGRPPPDPAGFARQIAELMASE
jgi:molecular chaperone HtpG